MPLAKQDWNRTPNSYTFDTLGTETIGPVAVGAGQVITAVQGPVLLIPCGVKVAKVGITFTATDNITTNAINVVYNVGSPVTTGGALGAVVANDDSNTGPAPGGMGTPSIVAVNNTPLFSSNVVLNAANFPGISIGGGGAGIFIPTNYDVWYPSGFIPPTVVGSETTPGVMATTVGYFTVRAITTTSIANLQITLFYVPVTPRQTWNNPQNPQNACVPGVAY